MLELHPTAERYPIRHEVREARTALLVEASRAGVTNETLGKHMQAAYLFERSGDMERARKSAQAAVDSHFFWGPKLGEGFMFSEGGTTLRVCVERFGASLPA